MRPSCLKALSYPPRKHHDGATVGVVIPCYNYARFLRQAVDSVLTQEEVRVDVVIVDDASTDDSLTVARALASQDSRVRVFANVTNEGAVATFNRGLAEVHGEFLVRLDADDLLTPGSLKRAVAVMQHIPSVGLVHGHPIHFAGTAHPRARETVDSWTVWRGQDWLAARCIDGTNTITSPEVVMRRSIVNVVGGQNPLAHTHDMEMWLRVASASDVARINGADQAWHREHPGSLSTRAEEPLVILGEIRDAFDTLFSAVGSSIDNAEELHQLAHVAVATEAMDQAARIIDRGQTSGAADLCAFAADCSGAVRSSARWRRLRSRVERADERNAVLRRLLGLFPRWRRSRRNARRVARWTRSGEFGRMRVRSLSLDNVNRERCVEGEGR